MKKRGLSWDITMCALQLMLIAAVFVFKDRNPAIYIGALILLALFNIVLLVFSGTLRRKLSGIMTGRSAALSSIQQTMMYDFGVPVVVVDDKDAILWYNDAFETEVLDGADGYLTPIEKFIPEFGNGLDEVSVAENIYQLFKIKTSVRGGEMFLCYFFDITMARKTALEYELSRPSVLHVSIDNIEEIVQDTDDVEWTSAVSKVEQILKSAVSETTGFMRKMGQTRYIIVLEERNIRELEKERFPVLDEVRRIAVSDIPVTLSVGVGRGGVTLAENDSAAAQALDMALGRGGDQVAIKSDKGYDFYGGVSRAVEKQMKVKARVIASACKDLLKNSGNVLVMGHRQSDLDSLGASLGVAEAARSAGLRANIVVNKNSSLASLLIDAVTEQGSGDCFVGPKDADELVEKDTLLVIVDVHTPKLLESEKLLKMCKNYVIIDHHRKMVGHIEDALIFYHEPYASSTCELVAEMLEYLLGQNSKLPKAVANGMLAGIMLDTRSFTVKTGVRTFQAAAYLKRMGAETSEAKRLFATTLDAYKKKSEIVSSAKIYKGCAISMAADIGEGMDVVIPQAADDLLDIEGVLASFVLRQDGSKISISARSLGECNVQIIMEALGGGGHHAMAGVQFTGETAEEIIRRLMTSIDNYFETENGGPKK